MGFQPKKKLTIEVPILMPIMEEKDEPLSKKSKNDFFLTYSEFSLL
jgi:hypothetical protein